MEIYIIIVLLIVVIGLLLLVNKELDLKHKELLNKIQILDNQIKNLWSLSFNDSVLQKGRHRVVI